MIRVTIEDLETGDTDTATIEDDWIVICDGTCYLSHRQLYPQKGTAILTIKGAKVPTLRRTADEAD